MLLINCPLGLFSSPGPKLSQVPKRSQVSQQHSLSCDRDVSKGVMVLFSVLLDNLPKFIHGTLFPKIRRLNNRQV